MQPHFNYCCVVWDNCNKTYADKLQKLQNRTARVLTSSSYDTAADSLLEKLGWRKLDTQRKFEKAVMVYKSLNGLAPDYLRPMFIDRSSVTNYSLRDAEGKLAVPKPRTNYLKNSFSYNGAVLWNSLPTELRKTNNLSEFKSGCSRFFNGWILINYIIAGHLWKTGIFIIIISCTGCPKKTQIKTIEITYY